MNSCIANTQINTNILIDSEHKKLGFQRTLWLQNIFDCDLPIKTRYLNLSCKKIMFSKNLEWNTSVWVNSHLDYLKLDSFISLNSNKTATDCLHYTVQKLFVRISTVWDITSKMSIGNEFLVKKKDQEYRKDCLFLNNISLTYSILRPKHIRW